jgi:hypothetical protein
MPTLMHRMVTDAFLLDDDRYHALVAAYFDRIRAKLKLQSNSECHGAKA